MKKQSSGKWVAAPCSRGVMRYLHACAQWVQKKVSESGDSETFDRPLYFRDELITRLPAAERNVQVERRYESPVNTFCIRAVTDDLERKAKLLR
jgi:hypothetical protein